MAVGPNPGPDLHYPESNQGTWQAETEGSGTGVANLGRASQAPGLAAGRPTEEQDPDLLTMARALCRSMRRKLKVLVADDRPDLLELLCEQLQCPAFDIRGVGTYKELSETARNMRTGWDCWLLDVMWEDDGVRSLVDLFPGRIPFPFTLLMTARARADQVSVLVRRGALHAFDSSRWVDEERSARELGIVGGLEKGGFDCTDLMRCVAKVGVSLLASGQAARSVTRSVAAARGPI